MGKKKHSSIVNSRKPFKLLVHFTARELNLLEEELQYFTTHASGKVYAKMLVYFRRWKECKPAEQALSLAAFVKGTDLPASPNAFDKLTSRFYNFLQDFLARQELQNDPVSTQLLAFRAYRGRNIAWPDIHRRYSEAQRELDKMPQTSRLSNARVVLALDMAILSSDRKIPPDERGYDKVLAALEADYVTQKLRLLCAISNHQKIFENPATDVSASEDLPPLRDSWPSLTRMYYRVFRLMNGEEDQASMKRLLSLLSMQDAASPDYPKEDMFDLYGYLLNALGRKVNRGNTWALRELSRLHDHLIAKGILEEDGKIPAGHFKNMISVKIKAGEIREARTMFNLLEDRIKNDPERNGVRYNHTLLLYAEQHLKDAAKELESLCGQTSNTKLDLYYGLDMRANLLRIYFDLLDSAKGNPRLWDEIDEKMVRLLDAFKGYIERKKIPKPRREKYETFRKLIQALYFAAYRRDPKLEGKERKDLELLVDSNQGIIDQWFRLRLPMVGMRVNG